MVTLIDHILNHVHYQAMGGGVLSNILKELTKNQYKVVRYLMQTDKYISPTEIGRDIMGIRYHSAWASPICKALVKKKLIKRNDKGHYRICKELMPE